MMRRRMPGDLVHIRSYNAQRAPPDPFGARDSEAQSARIVSSSGLDGAAPLVS